MGTTANKLKLLVQNKVAIKNAIKAKNPSVMPTDIMSQWPIAIDSIAGSGVSIEVKDGKLWCSTDKIIY